MQARKTGLTNDEVLAALRVCAKKLGHVPTRKQFRKLAGISEKAVSNRFGSYGKALRAAGFDPVGPGHQWSDDRLLLDWAAVARKLGKIPTKDEYSANSLHSPTPFDARWKSWREVGPAFERHARSAGIEGEWADVVGMVRASGYQIVGTAEHREELLELKEELSPQRTQRTQREIRKNFKFKSKSLPQVNADGRRLRRSSLGSREAAAVPTPHTAASAKPRPRFGVGPSGGEIPGKTGEHGRGRLFSAQRAQSKAGRKSEGKFENRKLRRVEFGKRALKPGKPVYGPRLDWPGMIFAPLCEDGVIFAFGMVAHRLGFEILRIRKAFPDCEAMREVQPGKWQHTWIEFEQESRNYAKQWTPETRVQPDCVLGAQLEGVPVGGDRAEESGDREIG